AAKALTPEDSPLPGHITVSPGGSGGRGNDASYLGPRYSSISLGNGNPPQNTTLPDGLTAEIDTARHDVRRRANERFLSRRRTALTDLYTYSYEQALGLMRDRDVFDTTKEPAAAIER